MENPDLFLSPNGFFFAFNFRLCGLSGCWLLFFVNTRSSVADRFPVAELYVGFWDAPKPGGIPIGFVKLQGF